MQAKFWLQQLSNNQEMLKEKCTEFLRCEEKIEAAYQELLQFALDARQKLKHAVSVAKEELNAAVLKAIDETSAHALESQWTGPTDALSELLWFADQRSIWSYELFTFQASCVKKSLDTALQVALSFSMPEFANLEIKTPSFAEAIEEATLKKETEVKELKAELEEALAAAHTAKQNKELLEIQVEEIERKLQNTESQLHALQEELVTTEERSTILETENLAFKHMIESLESQLAEMNKSKYELSERFHEPSDLRPSPQLAMFPKKNSLKIFNIGSDLWEDYDFSVNIGSVWTFTKKNEVFVCGGIDEPNPGDSAYLIRHNQGSRRLPDMRVARDAPGLIYDPDTQAVYVFGGSDTHMNYLKSSEALRFSEYHWQLLADMHVPRAYFNPCKYESDVYLCGGIQSSVEIYHIPSDSFTLLPDFVLPDSTKCTAVVESDSVVVISEGCIYRWNLEKKECTSCLKGDGNNLWSNCAPILVGRSIYIADMYGYRCIKAVTGDVEKEGCSR